MDKGKGIRFLNHAKFCKLLILVIDINDNPIDKFNILIKEMKDFGLEKPYIICLSKIDKCKYKKKLFDYFKLINKDVIMLSTVNNVGINNLIRIINAYSLIG